MAIVVDCREPPGLPALVETHWEPVLVRRLSVGDVSVGRVLVERKEAHDFVMCLRSGRLFRQVYSLRGASARPLVILEGDPYALVGPDRVRSLKGALLSLLTGYGIPVLRTRDLEKTAESLIQIAYQESKRAGRRAWKGQLDEAPGGSPCPARGPPPDPRALSILEALPDVGPVRAHALLRRFGSLDAILSSDPAELLKVPGVGPTTATRILGALFRSVTSLPNQSRDGSRPPS